MPDEQTVSIQQSTKGAVSDFLEREGIESIPAIKLVCFLCGALQRYEEEGEVLDPKILLTQDIISFIEAIPGGRAIEIGKTAFDDRSGKKILKECAPLARGGWHIFCQPVGDIIEFGVFSINESPTSLTLTEALETEATKPNKANSILIERVHAKEVVARASSENVLRIAFSTSQEAAYDIAAIEKFASACVRDISDDKFTTYFTRLLIRVLGQCHGTIFVAIAEPVDLGTLGLADGIHLADPIEMHPSFEAYDKSASADGVLELQRIEQLLSGFASSDGIVLFSTSGALLGYRILFEPPAGAPMPEAAIGGARRKAFEGLKAMIGQNLICVLFRSQDGVVECERASNAS